MSSNRNEAKIIKYRKPRNINPAYLIFLVIGVYLIIIVYNYITSKHIAGYEVKAGSLAVNNSYRAVALREEQLERANADGYISYYAREGERVAKGAMVCTIDSSGNLQNLLGIDSGNDGNLTNEDLGELRNEIISYKKNYSNFNFDSVYDFKYNVEGTVAKLSNKNVLASLNQITDRSILDHVNFGYSGESGIVVYSYDDISVVKDDEIDDSLFDEQLHEKKQLKTNEIVTVGDITYKLVTGENWSVVIEIDEEKAEMLKDEGYVKIRFVKTGDVSWGKINIIQNGDKFYCRLDFTNSMITYASERYIDIEMLLNTQTGLKVPNSAIVEKDFYLVSQNCVTYNETDEGLVRENYSEDGDIVAQFVPAQIYYSGEEDDPYCYVDTASFRLGDIILAQDSSEKYKIEKKAALVGVYNMNKGYADFTRVEILYQNREYAIVKSSDDMKNGLSVYDHIVLDGTCVNDDDFVY